MAMDAGDHRPDRRQFDVIVRHHFGPVRLAQRVGTVRAGLGISLHHMIRIRRQRPCHPGVALPPFGAPLRPVRLLALRRRRRRVVRGLQRLTKLGLQRGDLRLQGRDLRRLRAQLFGLRQDQRILLSKAQNGEVKGRAHPVLDSGHP